MTATPARAINRAHQIGSLKVGNIADVTVLKLVTYDRPKDIQDTFGIMRTVRQGFVPISVVRAGQIFSTASRDQDC